MARTACACPRVMRPALAALLAQLDDDRELLASAWREVRASARCAISTNASSSDRTLDVYEELLTVPLQARAPVAG